MRLSSTLALLLLLYASLAAGAARYEPTWDSLRQHQDPEWFRDAKFGIYFHWGVYSVPAFKTEWYPHYMYIEGHEINKHHVEKYGHPGKFGYKDFIKDFKAEHFDPDAWAELFKKAGARFAGPVTEHADGFAMWDSQLTKWDAMDMGPKRDIVGDLAKSIRKQDLKFITTFHHQWLWAWYPTWDERYDASNPAYAGLYGPRAKEGDFEDPQPTDAFCQLWMDKVKEVVDKYQPDLMWFDTRTDRIKEPYRREMVAHYYNQAAEWGRDVGITYKNKDLPVGVGILDLERGRMSGLTKHIWLNDDSIDWGSWCDVETPDYKSTDRLVDGLVDIVSKNGNLLLNITPRADGTIPEPVRERLLGIGQWLELNGEAIYETRPWVEFGEGPTTVKEGHFGEKHIKDFTAGDIRFTTKGKTLYAIVLAWPADRQLTITRMGTGQSALGRIKAVELIGHEGKVTWSRDESGLTIKDLPAEAPGKHAFVFKFST